MNIVISGPGGVGKGTLVARLLETDGQLWLSRSWTTRPRRLGESSDAYTFVTRAAFDERIADGGFLEWVEFLDYRQGTPTPHPPPGVDMVFEIDVVGAAAIRSFDERARCLFIDAPSDAALRDRLDARGEAPDRVQQRLELADRERQLARELDATFVINDVLDDAVREVGDHIARWRQEDHGVNPLAR